MSEELMQITQDLAHHLDEVAMSLSELLSGVDRLTEPPPEQRFPDRPQHLQVH